ncbi:hypothetical protein LCGC14_1046350 [marine sediment metagenome]|uniref:Uncharacterized protein n=1 Tax=marine sediment metagenome TaxID=412755 RepID=A0A0F9MQ95_9ZZZZ
MSYDYEVEKVNIFTDGGQRRFLKVRDKVNGLLDFSGAFMITHSGDTWEKMSYVDRMVELNEIREITGSKVVGQHRVFVRTNKYL